MYVQSKELKGHASNLKEMLNYALKETNDAKLSQKEKNYHVLDLQERMKKKA